MKSVNARHAAMNRELLRFQYLSFLLVHELAVVFTLITDYLSIFVFYQAATLSLWLDCMFNILSSLWRFQCLLLFQYSHIVVPVLTLTLKYSTVCICPSFSVIVKWLSSWSGLILRRVFPVCSKTCHWCSVPVRVMMFILAECLNAASSVLLCVLSQYFSVLS